MTNSTISVASQTQQTVALDWDNLHFPTHFVIFNQATIPATMSATGTNHGGAQAAPTAAVATPTALSSVVAPVATPGAVAVATPVAMATPGAEARVASGAVAAPAAAPAAVATPAAAPAVAMAEATLANYPRVAPLSPACARPYLMAQLSLLYHYLMWLQYLLFPRLVLLPLLLMLALICSPGCAHIWPTCAAIRQLKLISGAFIWLQYLQRHMRLWLMQLQQQILRRLRMWLFRLLSQLRMNRRFIIDSHLATH